MKTKKSFCHLILLLNLISNFAFGSAQKSRKNTHLIEDIQKNVNSVLDMITTNNNKDRDLERRLTLIENSITLISNRIEMIADSINNNKLINNFVNEKLDRIELKIKSTDDIMNNKVDGIDAKVELISNSLRSSEELVDGKLRKTINICGDTYKVCKDITISMNGRSFIGVSDDNQEYDKVDEMQKKVLEQFSIVAAGITSQLSELSSSGRSILTSCENNNLEMLNIRDECISQKSRDKNSRQSDSNFEESYTSFRNSGGSQSIQCPNVDISGLKQDIDSKSEQIMTKIENEMTIIDSKITEYSYKCNNNGRSIESPVPIVSNTSHVNQMPVLMPSRRPINPADKPTGRSGCQHSSELLAPKSCSELRSSGSDCDGIYVIVVANHKMLRVYCDMTDNGGGWTVILRRGDFDRSRHKVSFDQDWNGYKGGFGNTDSGEFWLGLENIYHLTSQENTMLQIDLESFDGEYISLVYDNFRIGSEAENYRLFIGNPIQSNITIAASLIAHNNSMFTTRDRNNGNPGENCGSKLSSGWWFHNCHSALLTAPYFRQHERKHVWQGMQWHSWKKWHHLKASQMKIKSKN